MTDDAHLAIGISEVPGVTLNASRMTGQYRFCVVVRPYVADRAILRLALVLLAIVVERRDRFDDLRIDYIKRRLARRGRRRRTIDRFVQVLLGAFACVEACQQNEGSRNYSL